MSETPELPPLDGTEEERSLGWLALNYRTAHTVHAQEQYAALEAWVRDYAIDCWDAGRRAGLEEAAKLADEMAAGWRKDCPDDPSCFVSADEIAVAIRGGGGGTGRAKP